MFHEVFISPFQKDTEAEARRVLDEIRQAHPANSGWKEVKAEVRKDPKTGKYYAVRDHYHEKVTY